MHHTPTFLCHLRVQLSAKVIHSFFFSVPNISGKTCSGCYGDQSLTSEGLFIKDESNVCLADLSSCQREIRLLVKEVTNFEA